MTDSDMIEFLVVLAGEMEVAGSPGRAFDLIEIARRLAALTFPSPPGDESP